MFRFAAFEIDTSRTVCRWVSEGFTLLSKARRIFRHNYPKHWYLQRGKRYYCAQHTKSFRSGFFGHPNSHFRAYKREFAHSPDIWDYSLENDSRTADTHWQRQKAKANRIKRTFTHLLVCEHKIYCMRWTSDEHINETQTIPCIQPYLYVAIICQWCMDMDIVGSTQRERTRQRKHKRSDAQ